MTQKYNNSFSILIPADSPSRYPGVASDPPARAATGRYGRGWRSFLPPVGLIAEYSSHTVRIGLRARAGSPYLRGAGSRTDSAYEGWLEFLPGSSGDPRWLVVNRIPLERYLVGVLPGEMPVDLFATAALEVQVIAARTYALYQIVTQPGTRIHVRDDQRSQVYLGTLKRDQALRVQRQSRGHCVTAEP